MSLIIYAIVNLLVLSKNTQNGDLEMANFSCDTIAELAVKFFI